jgi:hypothetical protein
MRLACSLPPKHGLRASHEDRRKTLRRPLATAAEAAAGQDDNSAMAAACALRWHEVLVTRLGELLRETSPMMSEHDKVRTHITGLARLTRLTILTFSAF